MYSTMTSNDGCKIAYHYYQNKDKPTLVLSNSLGTTMSMWEAQVDELKQYFSVLTYDMRGHGMTDVMHGGYSIDRLGCDLVNLLDHLSLDKVFFCGLSIGGMVGQWLATTYPKRVSALVLANTSAFAGPSDVWDERLSLIARDGLLSTWPMVRARWVSEGFAEQEPTKLANLKSMFEAMDEQGYIGSCAAVRDMDMRNTAKLNTLPTLLIAGLHDIASPVSKSEYLLSQYSNATLVVLDAGHLSNIEQSDKFNDAILSFFAC